MNPDTQVRLRENALAIFLHSRLHKSQKILMCRSDHELAKEIVALLEGEESPNEDDERPRVSSRRVQES